MFRRLALSTLFLAWCVLLPALPRKLWAGEAPHQRTPCRDLKNGSPSPWVRVWEQRSPRRLDEDLLFTDGLDFQRDIGVYVCKGAPAPGYVVRAWVRPKDGQWREIQIGEMTQGRKQELTQSQVDPETAPFGPAVLMVNAARPESIEELAHVTLPIRREGLRIGDNVRVEVRTDCDNYDAAFPICTTEVLRDFLTIDRYGLLSGFTDSILFVKRLGVGSTSVASGIDAANYRPAPGFNFGLTYLHRKHAFLQFLEPGFGFNVSLVDWKDTKTGTTGQSENSTNEPVQVTVGAMGSMFDNVITVVYGWNTNVSTDRSFVGVGFSVVGVVRKVMRSSH